jgi:hypothetical protein
LERAPGGLGSAGAHLRASQLEEPLGMAGSDIEGGGQGSSGIRRAIRVDQGKAQVEPGLEAARLEPS